MRWEDGRFEASLDYIVKPWLKNPNKRKNTHRRKDDNESFVKWEKTTPEAHGYMFLNVTILKTIYPQKQ